MGKNSPWWLKIFIKIIISRLPISYRLWKRMGLFEHGKMNSHVYSVDTFFSHLNRLSLSPENLKGLVILELGPGDSISTSIIASCFGAKTILLDAGDFVQKDLLEYSELINYLKKQGYKTSHLEDCHDFDDLLKATRTTYLTKGLKSYDSIPSDSIDIIISQAVLEHIRQHELEQTLRENKRILEKNGSCSHQIDLKDHLSSGLNNLRFKRRIWESNIFSQSGFYTNRVRFSALIEILKQIGFKVKVDEVNVWKKLPIKKEKLNQEFSVLSEEELLVKDFSILLKI
tara:strand:- start:572 stop:1429 length:858 start_codon:yes stop_codon:yes gene_type:complete